MPNVHQKQEKEEDQLSAEPVDVIDDQPHVNPDDLADHQDHGADQERVSSREPQVQRPQESDQSEGDQSQLKPPHGIPHL